jgi:Ca2+-binding RTX toxin-like protein
MAAMVVVYAGAAWAASVSEVEPNDSRDQPQYIDGSSFSLDSDPNIGDQFNNTSTIIPHATINGTGNDTVDWYSFTVSQAGDGVILDVDGAAVCNELGCNGWDSLVQLYDSSGQILAENSDALPEWGQGGSVSETVGSESLDSYLEYTFQTPGTYYVAVGSGICCGMEPSPIPAVGGSGPTHYQLQVSLGELAYYCNGQVPTIEAQPGQTVKGTKGDDVIAGTQGPDTINGNGGNDTICGKDGTNTINGGAGDDRIESGSGNDSINGGDGNDTIFSGSGNDSISGGAGDDRIDGGDGDNSISGGDGNDFIFGGIGKDRIKGDKGSDRLFGEDGDDSLDGGPGPDDLDGGPGDDSLDGGPGADYLDGSSGHDWCSIGEIGRDSCEFGPSGNP